MDNVAKRLDEACRLGGFSNRREMAEALGISYNTLNDWIRRGVLTEKGAIKIASKIPISQTYLLTGMGPVNKPDLSDAFSPEMMNRIKGSQGFNQQGRGNRASGVSITVGQGSKKQEKVVATTEDPLTLSILQAVGKLDEKQKAELLVHIYKEIEKHGNPQ